MKDKDGFDLCEHEGCTEPGNECTYPDGSTMICCDAHKYEEGFCLYCGYFSAGIESFHFWHPRGLCDNCRFEIEAEYERKDYDYACDFDPYEDK
jgi:hypothetical protein